MVISSFVRAATVVTSLGCAANHVDPCFHTVAEEATSHLLHALGRSVSYRSRRFTDPNQPAQQEEMMAAKGAPMGEKDPVQRHLQSVSDSDAPKIDRSAMWTAREEH
jgi:hypothetical protein